MIFLCLIVVSLAIVVAYFNHYYRSTIPDHLTNHHVEFIQNLIPESIADELNAMIREMKSFPSNIAADLQTGGFTPKHEHIGEAVKMENGICVHPYLVPNVNRTLCYLPQRVDVGRHFVSTGGVDGNRESYDILVRRVSSFGRYMMGSPSPEKYPGTCNQH